MFSATLGELSGVAGRRSVRGVLLPSLVFCCLALLVVATGRGSPQDALHAWRHGSWESKVLVVAGFLLALVCVATALGSAQTALIRLAEGYWSPPLRRTIGRLGRGHHRRLVRRADDASTHDRYPPRTRPDDLMPTRLGNALKAAELYPRLRYGIDAALVWPRLHPLLPDTFLATLGAARTGLTALLGSAFLSVVLAVGGAGYLWAVDAPTRLFLLCLWGGGLAGWLCYRGALLRAVAYGQHLRVAFDLYRGHLLDAVGRPVGDGEDERMHWQRLCLFWHRGVLPHHAATPDRPAQPSPTPAAAADRPPSGFSPSISHLTAAVFAAAGLAGALTGGG
ncbi:hypothetical protein AVW11_14265 [Streptomyces amritsarensis]|uniref:Integral membrane protein n=1 Tax=Streptomyces amritsarensis TaxID=681158 RepID=A0ABX3G781_9ACTN|nr:hypothetical protein [Streptomyces amritsarensis]OLZ67034.1 hypothetical protein AVW11_14265 [Streptomyces amritsarensis]